MHGEYLNKLTQMVQKGRNVFIAPNATVIGRVELGNESSVWFSAVIRGDSDRIVIGNRSNIQDGAVVHCDPGEPAHIGNDVIVGHRAIVHGAFVDDHTLVGMGATILNNARVGKFCIIGAHALVPAGMEIPDFSVVMGTPAKIVKQVTENQKEAIRKNAETYVNYAKQYNQ